ncbi:hypothetical protein J2W27_003599 [Variovorax boronicumulans]|uniref:DUF4123 domain-containing protein n=1 Tax=Variovorax boronicumulans TaxID=436515 RepID=UPI002789D240|nr:DUF4123 domain-containing protein [Variovorax boronicumulans]MDP9911475.1 hypothetical protein [Variovorax boronicumulans]
MSHFYFGQNPTDLTRVLDYFQQQITAYPEAYWFALVDTAFDHEQRVNLDYLGGISCYRSLDIEPLGDVAPRLFALDGHPSSDLDILKRLLRHCSERPMLSVLAADATMSELLDQWQPHHWVYTADGQKLLLRFADTRVLPMLPSVLNPDQWAALTSSVRSWFYIDRTGQPSICALTDADTTPAFQIELDARQLGTLVDRSEADTLLDYLVQHMFDVIPADASRATVYELLASTCTLAQTNGIDSWTDKVALATAACLTGSAFFSNPRLTEVLAEGDWPPNGLGERLVAESIV